MSIRRLGFYIARANYLKVMGPLIEHALSCRQADCKVVLLFPEWSTGKSQLRMTAAAIPDTWRHRAETRSLPNPGALLELIREPAIDALFSVQPTISDISTDDVAVLRSESLEHGIKWVALPEGLSQNGYVVTQAGSLLANWDLVCTLGPQSMRYIDKHLARMAPDVARPLRQRIVVVGYPEFDALATLASNDEIRQKYRLPIDKPVVLLATAARSVPLSVNTWTARGLDARFRSATAWSAAGVVTHVASLRYPTVVGYRTYLKALRRFADANGAVLVAKTRAKHHDPAWIGDMVDHLIDDRSFFPFTTLELMRTASLYFGFYSNTVIEAVVSGVYAITAVHMPPRAMQANPQWRDYAEAMTWGPEGLWNVDGVSRIIWGTRASGGAAVERFAASSLSTYRVDAERREAVVEDFFSYPCNSSARVLDALWATWN